MAWTVTSSFSPLLIGGRARGGTYTLSLTAKNPFQSPSHRGPRARLGGVLGGEDEVGLFQSPSHRGPRARRSGSGWLPVTNYSVSVPFS